MMNESFEALIDKKFGSFITVSKGIFRVGQALHPLNGDHSSQWYAPAASLLNNNTINTSSQ